LRQLLFFVTLQAMPNINKAHAAMLGVTVIFGLHYSIAKSLMPDYLSPLQLLFIRLGGATLLFWLFAPFFSPQRVEKSDLLKLALCGLVGLTLNVGFFYLGLHYTTPVDASVIHVSNPIMVLILSSLLIGEKITTRKVAGIVSGTSGALLLILWGRHMEFGGQTAIGNLLVTLNMLCYSSYLVILKPLTARYHPMTLLKWIMLFGFLFSIPFTAGAMLEISFSRFDWYGWGGLAYIIILTTFLVYILINYALKRLSPTAVSYYTYLQPVLAAISSVSVGMERITFPKVAAAILIFSGVYLVTGKGRRPARQNK